VLALCLLARCFCKAMQGKGKAKARQAKEGAVSWMEALLGRH